MKERIEAEISRNLKAATKSSFLAGSEVVKKATPSVKTLFARRLGEFMEITKLNG